MELIKCLSSSVITAAVLKIQHVLIIGVERKAPRLCVLRGDNTEKTIIFEEKYNTNISNFSTTEEVDEFLEKKLGRKLKVVYINTNIL